MQSFIYRATNFLAQMIKTTQFRRGLPLADFLKKRPEVAHLFQEAVLPSHVGKLPEPGPPLEICYKKGWLQAELNGDPNDVLAVIPTIYVFPPNLHKR